MKEVKMDKLPDGRYGICFYCKEYIRYLDPYTERIVKLEVELNSDSKEVENKGSCPT